jgi:hypothetical protein
MRRRNQTKEELEAKESITDISITPFLMKKKMI